MISLFAKKKSLKKKLYKKHIVAVVKEREVCLGIIAGAGDMPWMAATNAKKNGENVRIFLGVKSHIPEDFLTITEKFIPNKFYSTLLPALQRHKIKEVIILGKFTRELFYHGPSLDFRLRIDLLRHFSQSDYSLFQLLERILKRRNISILPQTHFLQDFFLREGRYGKRIAKHELYDIDFGMRHVKVLNELDIGQTVVVGNRCILAVEAAEGTNLCIERAGNIFLEKGGAVVCKISRENHDMRNDIPTIGVTTLDTMHRVMCRVLAFDAKTTLIVQPDEFVKKAKEYKISLLSVDSAQVTKDYLKEVNKVDRVLA